MKHGRQHNVASVGHELRKGQLRIGRRQIQRGEHRMGIDIMLSMSSIAYSVKNK